MIPSQALCDARKTLTGPNHLLVPQRLFHLTRPVVLVGVSSLEVSF